MKDYFLEVLKSIPSQIETGSFFYAIADVKQNKEHEYHYLIIRKRKGKKVIDKTEIFLTHEGSKVKLIYFFAEKKFKPLIDHIKHYLEILGYDVTRPG